MARTLKNFNTEEEYEEWVNSPYMRTPYTCLVKETGNVHYFDGDDDDYSITYVIRKDGWCEILPVAAKVKNILTAEDMEDFDGPYHVKVYVNGELVSLTDRRFSSQGSFYHRDTKFSVMPNAPQSGDFNDLARCHNSKSVNIERGVDYIGKQMIYPKHRIGCRKDNLYTRFFWAKKDDVIKITADSEFFEMRTRMDYFDFAKEIIIGDGVQQINWFNDHYYKKIFFGKNVKYFDLWKKLYPKDWKRSKTYTRKKFCPLITDGLVLFLDAKNNLGDSYSKNATKWVDKINGIEFTPDTGVNSSDRNKFYWGRDYITVTSGLSSDSPVFRTQWNPNIGTEDFTIIIIYSDDVGHGNTCPRGDYIFGTAGYGMSGANRWQIVFDDKIMFAHNVNNSWKYEITTEYPLNKKNCIAIRRKNASITCRKNGVFSGLDSIYSQIYGGTGGLCFRVTNLKVHGYLLYNRSLSDEDIKHMSVWATSYYRLK